MCGAVSGCALDGVAPPVATLHFPTGVAVSRSAPGVAPAAVYVVNSNFDYRYNASSLVALDLERVAQQLAASACSESTPCTIETLGPLMVPGGEVTIGSGAMDVAVSSRGDRLYVPKRTDASLAVIDVGPNGALGCGQGGPGDSRACSAAFQKSRHPAGREVTFPADPVRVLTVPLSVIEPTSGDEGDAVMVLDRAGAMLLAIDSAGVGGVPRTGTPIMTHQLAGLLGGATGLGADPQTGTLAIVSTRAFEMMRVGVTLENERERSFLHNAGSVLVRGLNDGSDARAVEFVGERALVLSRRPAALLFFTRESALGPVGTAMSVRSIVTLAPGASRMVVATLRSRTYAFVTCYDARTLFVVDVEGERVVSAVRGFSSPFGVAVDSVRERAYVSDFASSVLRVVDLSRVAAGGSDAGIVATLGRFRPARELR